MSSDCFAPAAWRRTASSTLSVVSSALRPGSAARCARSRSSPKSSCVGVERLAHAVREQHERLAGLQLAASRAVTGLSGMSPITRPDVSRTRRGGLPGDSRTAEWWPAVAAATWRCRRVDEQALQRHEHAAGVLLQELVVDAAQDLVGAGALARHAAQQRHRHGHEERGGDALAGDVADAPP